MKMLLATHTHTHTHTRTHARTHAPQVDIFSYAMLLFELLTGQRPFENLTTTQELNKAISQGDRPLVAEGNLEPAFPGMMDLMYDCWKQSSMERPSADEVSITKRNTTSDRALKETVSADSEIGRELML